MRPTVRTKGNVQGGGRSRRLALQPRVTATIAAAIGRAVHVPLHVAEQRWRRWRRLIEAAPVQHERRGLLAHDCRARAADVVELCA